MKIKHGNERFARRLICDTPCKGQSTDRTWLGSGTSRRNKYAIRPKRKAFRLREFRIFRDKSYGGHKRDRSFFANNSFSMQGRPITSRGKLQSEMSYRRSHPQPTTGRRQKITVGKPLSSASSSAQQFRPAETTPEVPTALA